ncbi:bifunctional hydroxymethylpyrimidine kinase/phosphomethylpyrimidine kinase [Stella sp.]|uniref:bifunctional hydroxymethylpyrimidine kinase/phosphomethylpyrimidine kinase n=1 Tax=Stella sp. TaxID=2912054 RepID=UPI0035AF360D
MRGRVLIVAGSDSGGGAGIQADIKAVTALGGFAMTAVTALTAQNTLGVHGVLPVAPDFIARQMAVVLDDLGADAVKTGMLHDVPVIRTVVEMLAARAPDVPLVCDPVMVAKGGHALLVESAVEALRRLLLPRAAVLTPNIPEAEALLGHAIPDLAAMERAVVEIRRLGPAAVLLKGGHAAGDEVVDILADAGGIHRFRSPRIATRHTHGTGCTLASAIAAGIAQGMPLVAAVARARDYVLEAIRRAPGYGQGHGPLDHGHTMCPPGG